MSFADQKTLEKMLLTTTLVRKPTALNNVCAGVVQLAIDKRTKEKVVLKLTCQSHVEEVICILT